MRPVFIADIDGTFAHAVNAMAFIKPHLHPAFPTAIEQLNKFCEETSALVAPISARLRIQPAKYFEKTMRDAGFTGEFHPRMAVSRSWRPFSRGKDLARFLEEERIPLEEVVIADDQPRYYTKAQMERLVQPKSTTGFDIDNRVEANFILADNHSGAWKRLQRFFENRGLDEYAWGAPLSEKQTVNIVHETGCPRVRVPRTQDAQHTVGSWRMRVTHPGSSAVEVHTR